MKTINIVGAGRVGKTLGALWTRAGVLLVGDVCTRTAGHARSALAFIGAGRAVPQLADMARADVWMIATPDAQIGAACAAIAQAGRLRAGDVVFHCSGALGAGELAPAADCGAVTASVHPLKSFADATTAASTFDGTYCVAEGASAALAVITPAFERIGARIVTIAPDAKPLYHAASALVCNDLTALMAAGLRCYEKAGIPRAQALLMMAPLVRDTVTNLFEHGPVAGLTGPVVRGDVATVALHVAQLRAVDPRIARIYCELSLVALDLARERAHLDAEVLKRLAAALELPDG